MLIVITPEFFKDDEHLLLNHFAKNSGANFHIRKPNANELDLKNFLKKLNSSVIEKSIIHSHHQLANEFDLKGIHYTEKERLNGNFSDKNIFKTTSFHQISDLVECKIDFNYQFLSPVFDSISKENYQGKNFDANGIDKKVIALGGINEHNISKSKELGFDGIAVLGAVWNQKNPVTAFEAIKKSHEQSFT